jgi:hypothetical protein
MQTFVFINHDAIEITDLSACLVIFSKFCDNFTSGYSLASILLDVNEGETALSS